MDYKIRWSKKSSKNIESIFNYIYENSPYFASITIKKIFNSIQKLKYYPNMGRIVPEFNDSSLREIIYKNYRIVYKIKDEFIEIVTIFHSSMDIINL